jgi:formate dehydrogenase alpha subunit
VAGLAASFGSGAMTNSIAEMKDTNCILLIGSNTTHAHPVISLELKKAVKRGAKLIVINPMRIEMVKYSHIWLQNTIGSDVALLCGMAKVLLDEGLADKEFIEGCCENFSAFRDSLQDFTLDKVSQLTGIAPEQIVEVARLYATQKPASILYTLGITEHTHGTDNVLAIANMAMLTGNIGKPSTGVNPLRGQNNVQGSCDMGCLPNVYQGYQKVSDPEIQKKFENAWGGEMDPNVGLTMIDMLDPVPENKLKALYIVGENPVLSEPDMNHVIAAIKKMEFVVVHDIFLTETAKLADVVLPAASFAEEDGTFTNTERRVQRVRRIIDPVGESRPNWKILCQVAGKMGVSGFDFNSAAEIMDEIARLTPSMAGLSHERLETCGIQWPCPTSDHPGTMILHMSRFACGLGKFAALKYRPPAEWADDEYPFVLTTGRSLYHYHTGTMTRKVKGLNVIEPEDTMKIHPADAEKLGIADGEMVKVTSRRGDKVTRAKVTDIVQPGVVYMDFHFGESPTNILTNCAVDPVCKVPEYKVCGVRIEKIPM